MGFSFSTNTSPKRESLSNMGNLKEDSCHKDYTFWKKDLDGLDPNSWLLREWVCKEGEKWIAYWCMPLFLSLMLFFDFCVFLFSLFLPYSISISWHGYSSSPLSLFITIAFYTICHGKIYNFYPSTAFGLLWAFFQDYPLACWLPDHYHYTMLAAPCLIPRQNGLSCLLPLFFHHSHLDKG